MMLKRINLLEFQVSHEDNYREMSSKLKAQMINLGISILKDQVKMK